MGYNEQDEMTDDQTVTSSTPSRVLGPLEPVPVLLVAFRPESTGPDRRVVGGPLLVGRDRACGLVLDDDKASKQHLRISRTAEGFVIEDLSSTNGTFLDGGRVVSSAPLPDRAVIRIGRTVLVFHRDGAHLLEPPPRERYGMAGRFHVARLIAELREAALSERHMLIAGPSGTGKELAARALAALSATEGQPLSMLAHNAARFASPEEAASTLFGVGGRVFSNVDARPGLIEQARGGVLFLDEMHNLPERVQRTLLRVIEGGEVARIGETRSRPAEVRFVLASNATGATRGLAHDLFARLRLVELQPLAERAADVPDIFDAVLTGALRQHGIDPDQVRALLGGDHAEALCLDGFATNNVRGLVDLADRLATRIASGMSPAQAVTDVFGRRFSDGPVARRNDTRNEEVSSSRYESHREVIIAAYRESGMNLTATERLLKARGLRCSRRWLAVFLEKWSIRDRS
jgi:DNA-binding NtrC family response regulator